MSIKGARYYLGEAVSELMDALPVSVSRHSHKHLSHVPEDGLPTGLFDEGHSGDCQNLLLVTRRADYHIYLRGFASRLRPLLSFTAR